MYRKIQGLQECLQEWKILWSGKWALKEVADAIELAAMGNLSK